MTLDDHYFHLLCLMAKYYGTNHSPNQTNSVKLSKPTTYYHLNSQRSLFPPSSKFYSNEQSSSMPLIQLLSTNHCARILGDSRAQFLRGSDPAPTNSAICRGSSSLKGPWKLGISYWILQAQEICDQSYFWWEIHASEDWSASRTLENLHRQLLIYQ